MATNDDHFDEKQLNRFSLEISSNLLSSNLYSFPSFGKDDNTSASAWLNKFETVCNHFNWSDEQ